ncbi:glycine zipper 2TM domain-containing protein [Sphingobium sp. AN641]|uniref:glycine zipper 2TM domain-containing protein n=1 Tax=Sphingobium sp. AN641 TaxID=3133443 RepID=UPI0030C0AFDF
MRTPILLAAMAAVLPLGACVTDGGRNDRYGYDRPGDRRGPPYRRQLRDNDQIYRDRDGRYYCKRDDGTTGTIVGALAGGVLGNIIAPGGSKTLGTILGAGGGALAGRAIDRNDVNCE